MADDARLIETAFPLKQASLDSVHEKNVRHGHISTLHIWPARRPLAACRAAILATLLPDPGTAEKRRKLCERIGGTIEKSTNAEQRATEKTVGGILHWPGSEPKGSGKAEFKKAAELRERELAHFRNAILAANNGRPPKVYDPFSGGGAIPLEAMRLGCETYANDLNPVSVFLLGAALKYPQAIGAKKLPLPGFIRQDGEFMAEFLAACPHGQKTLDQGLLGNPEPCLADLSWHVRAWGKWVLAQARKKLARRYPTYASYEPVNPKAPYERQEDRLVPPDENGEPDIGALNRGFDQEYLQDEDNPRWQLRPTVAYLWARTAICPNCRKTIPLLKTKWLCRTKSGKRVALKCEPESDTVVFDVWNDVPLPGGSEKEKKEKDQQTGKGYMSRSGATCPHPDCHNIATMDDLKRQGKAGQLGAMPTAVVYEGRTGKQYRPWRKEELEAAMVSDEDLAEVFRDVPFGLPEEPMPDENALGMRIPKYGYNKWRDLFSPRQLLALGTLVTAVREAIGKCDRERESFGYDDTWVEAIGTYLALSLDRIADRQSTICRWDMGYAKLQGTFVRFALPMTWDYCEGNPLSESTGNFYSGVEWIAKYVQETSAGVKSAPAAALSMQSASENNISQLDAIITDPPYYDAIPYSDCMDFFYVWLKRVTKDTILDNGLFASELSPKWDTDRNDGELIDDAARHGNNKELSRKAYEDGMARVFQNCHASLTDSGRFVVVFAHKNPAAWETLVSAIIRAGFVVTASWPIQTEMGNRMRGLSSAALSSSVWLVCKKRPAQARAGWDTKVLAEMEANITEKLREFWDAGIRGPDFVWAATGPALSAYSAHPVVKKTSGQGESMGVSEFLGHVRKMVVNFVVGRLLSAPASTSADEEQMDGVTAYYLLHRNDFGMGEAPAGACILYATACGLTDRDLEAGYRLLKRKGASADDDPEDEESETSEMSGGKMALVSWSARRHESLGLEAPGGADVPLIDRAHKLMHLWKAGDLDKVDAYIDSFALRSSELFGQLLQALTELSQNQERSLLESISNHLHGKGSIRKKMTSRSLMQ